MVSYLCDLIDKYRSLSIIGMCKNAGKTTVLNHIIHGMAKKERLLALTSIGRDGESKDLVTGTDKSRIYIKTGSLIATASRLLKTCDITKEIVLNTGISTPLGEVIILRALSDGYVQLAGPSMINQLEQLSGIFSQLGAEKFIIDGALARRTLSARSLSEATILCTGASCGVSMETVVSETKHIVQMFSLPPVTPDTIYITLPSDMSMNIEEGFNSCLQNGTAYLYINGALTNVMLHSLFMSSAKIDGIKLLVKDASKILINAANYEKLRLKNSGINVLEGINLIAVTINPFSAYGYDFDKKRFRNKLADIIDVPVINVEDI